MKHKTLPLKDRTNEMGYGWMGSIAMVLLCAPDLISADHDAVLAMRLAEVNNMHSPLWCNF